MSETLDIDQFELSDRQRATLERWASQATDKGIATTIDDFDFTWIRHHPMRPERGHDVRIFHGDGEHVVAGFVDIYGNGWCNYAEIDGWRDIDTITDHSWIGVAGHPDDGECTHRSDGTDDTYCGEPDEMHETSTR